jgi:hypothetical protein
VKNNYGFDDFVFRIKISAHALWMEHGPGGDELEIGAKDGQESRISFLAGNRSNRSARYQGLVSQRPKLKEFKSHGSDTTLTLPPNFFGRAQRRQERMDARTMLSIDAKKTAATPQTGALAAATKASRHQIQGCL